MSVRHGCALQPTRAHGLAARPGDLALGRFEAGCGARCATGIRIAAPVVADALADFDGRSDRQVRIVSEKVHNTGVAATFFGQHLTLFLHRRLPFPSFAPCLYAKTVTSLRRAKTARGNVGAKNCDEPAKGTEPGLAASRSRVGNSLKKSVAWRRSLRWELRPRHLAVLKEDCWHARASAACKSRGGHGAGARLRGKRRVRARSCTPRRLQDREPEPSRELAPAARLSRRGDGSCLHPPRL